MKLLGDIVTTSLGFWRFFKQPIELFHKPPLAPVQVTAMNSETGSRSSVPNTLAKRISSPNVLRNGEKLLKHLTNVQLILVIGEYAQSYHMPDTGDSVTDRVQSWRDRWPDVVPLPHPSPRNNIWLKRNPWFDAELLPVLQVRIREILES